MSPGVIQCINIKNGIDVITYVMGTSLYSGPWGGPWVVGDCWIGFIVTVGIHLLTSTCRFSILSPGQTTTLHYFSDLCAFHTMYHMSSDKVFILHLILFLTVNKVFRGFFVTQSHKYCEMGIIPSPFFINASNFW